MCGFFKVVFDGLIVCIMLVFLGIVGLFYVNIMVVIVDGFVSGMGIFEF